MWDLVGKIVVALFAGRFVYSCCKGLYGSYVAALFGLNINLKKCGQWAVVTGATDGIGKSYCKELARRGLNIVLVSRTASKLETVAAEIRDKFKVETKIIAVDFTSTEIYDILRSELAALDVGVLVNNVGMSYDWPDFFGNISQSDCQCMINCNVISTTMMSHFILPLMAGRGRGVVINIASLSATIPAPFLAVYGATKAYIESLSESLAAEYSSKGVTVQCVLPGYVVSNMSKIRRATLMAPTADDFVRGALKTTGVEKRTGGYVMHKVQIYFVELARQYLASMVLTNVVYNQLNLLRIRAEKKKAQ